MNNLLNKKHILEIEVLTPLHIGAGAEKDWMEGADFIRKDEKIYKLNHKKLEKIIGVDTLSNFLIKRDSRGLANKISDDIEKVSDQIFINPVSSTNDIKAFIKNGLSNKPIIPGSSVKGAIRSILFKYLKENHQKDEKQVFETPNKGDEFMRFIKISDAQFEKTKLFNLYKDGENWKGGWKHKGGKFGVTNSKFKPTGFNTIYEIINQNEIGQLTISFADKALDNLIKIGKFDVSEKKKDIIYNDLENNFFVIINSHTKEYINKEIAFFEKYANNETDKIIDSLNSILNEIPHNNSSCVLKMSAGSGFHSITGDWQHNDFSINGIREIKNKQGRVIKRISQLNGKKSAKSRKIATDDNRFELMGFVKLTVLSDDEIARREFELQQKLQAEQQQKQAKIKAKQEAIKKVEEERQKRIEDQKRKEQERIAEEKRIEEERLALIIKKEEELKIAQEKNKALNAQKISNILDEGLLSINKLNNFNEGKGIIEQYFKAKSLELFQGEDADNLKYFIRICIEKNNKRWKKFSKQNWKLIIKWIGKPEAQKWFNEIIKN